MGVVLKQAVSMESTSRPVTSLGHQEGRRVFREGPKFFELCPIFLNYVQHIFPVAKNFLGGLLPTASPLVTGLGTRKYKQQSSKEQRIQKKYFSAKTN